MTNGYQMTWDEAAAIAVRHARKNTDTLEKENQALRAELAPTTTTKQRMIGDLKMNTEFEALRTLDTLAKSATADHHQVAKRLEDLMETRVDAIQKSRDCTRSQAYAQASRNDAIFQSAYKLSLVSQDQAVQRQTISDGLAPHM